MHKVLESNYYSSCTGRSSENVCSSSGGAQAKRKEGMKLSLPPKLVGKKLVWVPGLFCFSKISFPVTHLMPYYAETGRSHPHPNRLTLRITLMHLYFFNILIMCSKLSITTTIIDMMLWWHCNIMFWSKHNNYVTMQKRSNICVTSQIQKERLSLWWVTMKNKIINFMPMLYVG